MILETFAWILAFCFVCLHFEGCHLRGKLGCFQLIDNISEGASLFHTENFHKLSRSFDPSWFFSDVYYVGLSASCYSFCLRKLKPSLFSLLHASHHQGDLVMLKFGFSNCYTENKSESDSGDSVDAMIMYMCFMLLRVMTHEVLFYLQIWSTFVNCMVAWSRNVFLPF